MPGIRATRNSAWDPVLWRFGRLWRSLNMTWATLLLLDLTQTIPFCRRSAMFKFRLGVAFGAASYWAWQSFGRDLLGLGGDQDTYGGYSGSSSFGSRATSGSFGSSGATGGSSPSQGAYGNPSGSASPASSTSSSTSGDSPTSSSTS